MNTMIGKVWSFDEIEDSLEIQQNLEVSDIADIIFDVEPTYIIDSNIKLQSDKSNLIITTLNNCYKREQLCYQYIISDLDEQNPLNIIDWFCEFYESVPQLLDVIDYLINIWGDNNDAILPYNNTRLAFIKRELKATEVFSPFHFNNLTKVGKLDDDTLTLTNLINLLANRQYFKIEYKKINKLKSEKYLIIYPFSLMIDLLETEDKYDFWLKGNKLIIANDYEQFIVHIFLKHTYNSTPTTVLSPEKELERKRNLSIKKLDKVRLEDNRLAVITKYYSAQEIHIELIENGAIEIVNKLQIVEIL